MKLLLEGLLVLLAPAILHFGALRGAPIRPVAINRSISAEVFLFKHLYLIMFLSGVLSAAAFFLWQAHVGNLWVVPAALAAPTIAAQVAALILAVARDVNSGST